MFIGLLKPNENHSHLAARPGYIKQGFYSKSVLDILAHSAIILTMEIEIQTQIEENYGTRWKMKGGEIYLIPVSISEALQGSIFLENKVRSFAEENLVDNYSYREYVLDWWLQ